MKKLFCTLMLSLTICGVSHAEESWNLEIDANSSVFMLKGEKSYNGMVVTPELRLRREFKKGHGVYIAAGVGTFTQFIDDEDETAVIQNNDENK